MQKWAENIKNVQGHEPMNLAIVAANNHYAGFRLGTVNIFRWECQKLSGKKRKWKYRNKKINLPLQVMTASLVNM